jgi:microcompartment protein CcmK/EutM
VIFTLTVNGSLSTGYIDLSRDDRLLMVERIDIESNSSTEVAFDEIKIKIYGRTKQI